MPNTASNPNDDAKGSVKFRPQRGGYEESMAACVELDATYESLARHLNACVEDIEVDFYCHDTRGVGEIPLSF